MAIIRAHQVKSRFNEGMDTFDIAKLYGIPEARALELLDEARMSGFSWSPPSADSLARGRARGCRVSAVANRKVPVTLADISFLRDVK